MAESRNQLWQNKLVKQKAAAAAAYSVHLITALYL